MLTSNLSNKRKLTRSCGGEGIREQGLEWRCWCVDRMKLEWGEKMGQSPDIHGRERQKNAWETPLLNEEAFFLSVTVTFVLQRTTHIDAQTPTQSDVPIAVEHRLLTENLITASVRSLISSYPSQLTPLISISSLFTFLEDWIWCDIIAQCGGLFDRSR